MLKKSNLMTATFIVGVLVLLVGVINIITVQNQTKAVQNQTVSRFVSLSSSIRITDGKLNYAINLTNRSDKKIFIQSVQPLVNEKLKNKILSKNMVVTVNKEIQPNKAIAITGKIVFDKKGFTTTKEIAKFQPVILNIKVVSTEAETISLSPTH
ncbi:hypothetical protein [Clostridium estertheticum]|uniref:Uncharacterized protein n=1 Tax=Clostridium estertheticum subsp. estertheticum TaxID=1552 RepID=A0A1J0GPI7_9CLOT|nr:hypothetical protein [Clostridium estertheticum]APC42822.1 hypothetical protein A7L45_22035 [Clostridium estertheticum subsp. estertheticum]